MNFYKRIKVKIAVLIFLCFSLYLSGCNGVTLNNQRFYICDGFSVNFIDVGEGDATLIRFPDGKTMLIDCGERSTENLYSVEKYLNEYCDSGLDYLMLTHPDSDHVGNAASILEDFRVKTAFVPYIRNPELFADYYRAYLKLNEKSVETEISAVYKFVAGENYFLVELSPNGLGTGGSSYTLFNDSAEPTAKERNNLSPIVYLEYNGVKFLFTGDADFSQEKVALNNVKLGLIDAFFGKKDAVVLENLDFLKVGHHGSADSAGEDLLRATTPKNAVISVGGDNVYGHPTSETLERILEFSPNCNILRTSILGNITVTVSERGEVSVHTSSGKI